MPGAAGAAPAAASRLDHVGIIAVEEVQAARVGPEVCGFDAVDEHQYRGAVGVFLTVRQPDRLQGGMTVGDRAVRQEGGLLIGPQRRTQMFSAVLRPRPDDDPVALNERALEELWQGPFERRRQKMVKADLGQRMRSTPSRSAEQ